ncbi:MAG: hypothetical protein AAGK32_05985, partial [Actinomycetota bacterium]
TAMFNTTNMVPGDTVSNCIEVDYTGSSFDLDPVTMYGSATDNGLGDHLDVVISEGTGGGFGDCTGFSGSTTFTGTVNGFASTHPAYGTGDAGYTPASGSTARVYKIDVTLGSDTPNTAQGADAQASFTWEVRSA